MAKLLFPLSQIYGLMAKIDRKLTTAMKLPRPVISVGNITWGGTGKTPVVIKLARKLVKEGLRPVVLTRGYRRKNTSGKCLLASDGKGFREIVEKTGDEPFLISESVPGAAVVVGSDRVSCGRFAMERLSPDVFILDDGFQHWRLKRDLDIVCVSASNPFGNGCLIPAGILREPVSALGRAGLVIITNPDMVSENELREIEKNIEKFRGDTPLRAVSKAAGMRQIVSGDLKQISEFQGGRVAAFSAIGDNSVFRKTLEANGLAVEDHFAFRDHHWFTPEQINTIASRFRCPLVTTAKDAARLGPLVRDMERTAAERFFALEIDIEFTKGESLWEEKIQSVLRPS